MNSTDQARRDIYAAVCAAGALGDQPDSYVWVLLKTRRKRKKEGGANCLCRNTGRQTNNKRKPIWRTRARMEPRMEETEKEEWRLTLLAADEDDNISFLGEKWNSEKKALQWITFWIFDCVSEWRGEGRVGCEERGGRVKENKREKGRGGQGRRRGGGGGGEEWIPVWIDVESSEALEEDDSGAPSIRPVSVPASLFNTRMMKSCDFIKPVRHSPNLLCAAPCHRTVSPCKTSRRHKAVPDFHAASTSSSLHFAT